MENAFLFVWLAMLAFIALIPLAFWAMLMRPWLRAALHATPVPLLKIIGMRMRGNPPLLLIDAYISLKRTGISTTVGEVESVYIDSKNRVFTSDDLAELVKQRACAGGRFS